MEEVVTVATTAIAAIVTSYAVLVAVLVVTSAVVVVVLLYIYIYTVISLSQLKQIILTNTCSSDSFMLKVPRVSGGSPSLRHCNHMTISNVNTG